MRIKNILTFSFIMAVAFSCDVGNEYGYGYNNWYEYDLDEDEVIMRKEFDEAWERFGAFEEWDQDGDGYLDEREWLEGSRDYYGEWDTEEMGYFHEWDTNNDGQLSVEEVAFHTFDRWDLNNDGEIQKEEFNMIHPEY